MTLSKELPKLMSDLGFTKYEIQIMLVLYEKNSLKADEIAELSKVPLARTYDALEILKRKHFVNVSQGRPRFFSAENPQIAISNLLELEKNKYDSAYNLFVSTANELLSHANQLYLENHTQITPEDLLTQFSTLKEAEEYTLNLIQSCDNTIDIFSHMFNWYEVVKDDLNDAINRGCKIRILLHEGNIDKLDNSLFNNENVKLKTISQKSLMARGTLIDKKAVIFIIWAGSEHGRRIYRPQFSSNPGIVEVFNSYYDYLWNLP